MAIIDREFTRVDGVTVRLSERYQNNKEFIMRNFYDGLTTVTNWVEGGTNHFENYNISNIELSLLEEVDSAIGNCLPTEASGDFLDSVTSRAGVFRNPEGTATVPVKFKYIGVPASTIKLSAGLNLSTFGVEGEDSIFFELEDDVILAQDEDGFFTGDSTAICSNSGPEGNIMPNTLINIDDDIGYEITVTNPEAGTGGTDEEEDDDLRKRALDSAGNLWSGTAEWFESVAKTITDDVVATFLKKGNDKIVKIVYKPTANVSTEDLINLFNESRYSTGDNLIFSEAQRYDVIDRSMSINLILDEGANLEVITTKIRDIVHNYVYSKILQKDFFKKLCIKILIEEIEGVKYCDLEGYSDVTLSVGYYATIEDDDLNNIIINNV